VEQEADNNIHEGIPQPNVWSLKEGTVPDDKEFPISHAFGIPTRNKQTVLGLMAELSKVMQDTNEPNGVKVPAGGFVRGN